MMKFDLKTAVLAAMAALDFISPVAVARMSMPGAACEPETRPALQPLRITDFGTTLLNDGDANILVSCPIQRVGENVADLWINVLVDSKGVIADEQMDCYAVREAMANGLPPALETVDAKVFLGKPGTQDVMFPDFKEKAGASDVYVITCSLPPKVAIKGYNWEGK